MSRIKIFREGAIWRAELTLVGTTLESVMHPRIYPGSLVLGYGSNPETAVEDAVKSLGKICLDCLFTG